MARPRTKQLAPPPAASSPTEEGGAVTSDASGKEKKEKKQFFSLVVDSFTGKLPGEDGYDPEKDRLRMGFQFGHQTVPTWLPLGTRIEEVTAYDFLTSPKTGLRAGQAREPWGTATVDLTDGVDEYKCLPPVEIWARGSWISDLIWNVDFDLDDLPMMMERDLRDAMEDWPARGIPASFWNIWLVSGEGTPNNDLYKLYKVPKEQAAKTKPQHPAMWPEALRKKTTKVYGSGYTHGSTPTVQKPAAKPTIPAAVRMRCPGCGHWFKMDDLVSHNKVCEPGSVTDWAMMCDPACGCRTLDEASTPKPGFPRPKPEAVSEAPACSGTTIIEPGNAVAEAEAAPSA